MTSELPECTRRGCHEPELWQESQAAVGAPGLCEQHAAEVKHRV